MARLKFLLFALVALGLWAYHLTMVAPLAVAGSVEQAQAAVAGAAGPVAVALESQRSLTQAVALKVATSNAVWNVGPKPGAKAEAPGVDRFATVRTAAGEALPAEQKGALFLALTNEVGTLWAKGEGEPGTEVPEGLDLAGVMQAGAAGSVRSVDGVSYLLLSAPLLISDKNEVRATGSVIIGLPVLPQAKALEQAQKALGLETLALVSEGKPVLVAGDKAAADTVLKSLKAGAMGALASGPVREVGPLQLPMLTDSLAQAIGGRQAIGGTDFEVAASASSKAALDALAGYQLFGFGALGGLLLLSIVFTLIMGGSSDEGGAAMVLPPPVPVPPSVAKRDEQPTLQAPLSMPEPQPAPEASPDDFDFPPSSPSQMVAQPPPVPVTGQAPAYQPEPASDPFESAAPPPPPPPPPAPTFKTSPPPPPIATSEAPALQRPGAGLMDDDDGGQRTVAYPAFKPPPMGATPSQPPIADPFALAAAQEPDAPAGSHEDNPDATRVAAIPAELIKAARSASGNTSERPALRPTGSLPKVASLAPATAANDEEKHFQEVFRDFVATREKCREPADGLTFDKFKAKLLKNKEQLVAKYQCKTVRFQVYVKDGKAALKATPVKD